MLHLAGLREKEIAQVAQIAEANHIPKKFLDQIFADLRRAGLVHSKKGKAGGYALAKPANKIQNQAAKIEFADLQPFEQSDVAPVVLQVNRDLLELCLFIAKAPFQAPWPPKSP